ncbi:MAG TPA: glutamate formimidoyltransferase [Armatimonadota bacterium]|jgi:glutamate formiminotransferase
MTPIFQSAPNFSEGREAETLRRLRDAARVPGAALCDFSADIDHNRCVATLVGDAAGLERAAVEMARVAVERIDLRAHEGRHPFVGALDVLPFIPLRDATMDDAVRLAHTTGARIAGELSLPVYYYAAASPENTSLPALRKGGLAGLAGRMRYSPPDEGPAEPHPTAGVAIVGAREPLIAYNVNLASNDVRIAVAIAKRIRESGGGLPGVRALGIFLASRDQAQVSVNITDTRAVSMADVFDVVRALATAQGVHVAGAELIGGISNENLLRNAGRDFGCVVEPNRILDNWLP